MSNSSLRRLSIVIPAYNEEKTVGLVLDKLKVLEIPGFKKEVIVVDDGSGDKTSKIVSEKEKTFKELKLILHEKNKGKGAAVATGLKSATGDILMIQDADLEYDPNDIPRLIEPIAIGKAQVVYGSRLRKRPILFGANKTPFLLHFFGNKFLSFLTTVMYGRTVSDMETCYKAFTKKAIEGITFKSRTFDFEPEITAKILKRKINIHEIDIDTKPRSYEEGKKLHTFRDGFKALWTLFKYRFTD